VALREYMNLAVENTKGEQFLNAETLTLCVSFKTGFK
jgi:hypothetical protein